MGVIALHELAAAYQAAPKDSAEESAALDAFVTAYVSATRAERATLRHTDAEFWQALSTMLAE